MKNQKNFTLLRELLYKLKYLYFPLSKEFVHGCSTYIKNDGYPF